MFLRGSVGRTKQGSTQSTLFLLGDENQGAFVF